MRIEVGTNSLGYEVAGEGPALVLLHAFPLNRAMWKPQVDALRDRFKVVTPDFRGFGESGLPGGPMTVEEYAIDTLGLLDQLGIDSFVLGGCSMGGYVAFRIAAQAPKRVKALVLADTRAEADSEEGRQRRSAAIARIDSEGPGGFLEEFAAQVVGPTTREQRPQVVRAVREVVGSPPAESLTAALSALGARPDSTPLLTSITVPALVVVGEEDTLTPPSCAEAIAAGIRGALLFKIPGAGHLANMEAAEAFNGAARAFLLNL